ncbi:hypothetical protein DVH05_010081 [Phytophthora capsici]|nr:hypothetical protein DVH05_010081 [Phytophthora capsici]
MRASIVILVAVVAVFTSSGLASASNPVQLQQSVPGVTNKVESADGGRFLREELKDESDDLTSEERGALQNLATKAKRAVKGEYLLARLFKKKFRALKVHSQPSWCGRMRRISPFDWLVETTLNLRRMRRITKKDARAAVWPHASNWPHEM